MSLLLQIVFYLAGRSYVIKKNSGGASNSSKLLTVCDGVLIPINFHILA
ncbi:MAG: hypothetical protein H7221_08590 [Flavobacterium sp.]|nr:hypothetical protein [Flavobacterium sp.]